MKRRSFIRDMFMGVAISFLPKVLHPSVPEIKEELVEVMTKVKFFVFDPYEGIYSMENEPVDVSIMIPKSVYQQIKTV